MSNAVSVNGKLYNFNILPIGRYVYAEIYYFDDDNKIQVLNKEFGRFWRKQREQDYKNANKWCKDQIEYIREYNN